MEYLPTNLLEEHIKEPKMKIGKAQRIMRDVFSALQYLHDQNITHRDIKMSNTLLTSNKRAKLCDFGLARQLCPEYPQTCAAIYGTSNYLAPEIFVRGSKLSLKSDIWSAGVILFGLITDKMPFADDKRIGQKFRVMNCIYDNPDCTANSKMMHLAFQMLEDIFVVDVNHRPSATKILDHVFFKASEHRQQASISNAFESSGSNVSYDLMNKFNQLLRNNRVHVDHQLDSGVTTEEHDENIWLTGFLPGARKLGLAYVLSDGKMAILFKNGDTVYIACDKTELNDVVYICRGKKSSTNDRDVWKKVRMKCVNWFYWKYINDIFSIFSRNSDWVSCAATCGSALGSYLP